MLKELKGGRGNKAPYFTKVIRIPLPLENQINDLINEFHQETYAPIIQGIDKKSTQEIHIQKAKEILKNNKSPKIALQEFLSFLHEEKIKL